MSGTRISHTRMSITVGRRLERAALMEALIRASERRPRIVVLQGEAGIGKSHLLRELVQAARQRSFRVGIGHAVEHSPVPYMALDDAARPIWRGGPRPPARAVGDSSRSAYAAPLALTASPAEWPQFIDALLEIAQHELLLLALDDLHWLDEGSLQLLLKLAFALSDGSDGYGLLLALTTRPPECGSLAESVLLRLLREPICERVELLGLDLLDTVELLGAAGLPRCSPSTVRALHEGTGGNPLFIKGLMARAQRGPESDVEAALDPSQGALPNDLSATVRAQVDAADPAARELLRLAALIGQRFSLQLLGELAGRALEDLRAVLGRCPELVQLSAEQGELVHPLVRHELAQGLPTATREQLHAEIARALPPAAGVLQRAHHVLAAGSQLPAAERCILLAHAGQEAERLFAFARAAQFYAAAAALESEPRARAELHFRAATCHHQHYDRDAGIAHYQAALGLYEGLADHGAVARVLGARTRLGLYRVALSKLQDVEPLQAALARLAGADDVNEGWLHCALADVFFYGRRPVQGEAAARRALEIATRWQDDRLARFACLTLGLSQAHAMQFEAAERSQERALEHARASGDPTLEAAPRVRRAIVLQVLGRLSEARAECEAAIVAALRMDDAAELAFAHAVSCGIDAACGRFAAAGAHATDMLRWLGRADARPWAAIVGVPAYAYVRAARDQTEDALTALAALTEKNRFVERVGRAEHIYKNTLSDLLATLRGAARDDDAGQARRAQVELYCQFTDPENMDGMGLLAVCALCELCVYYQLPAHVVRPRAAVQRALERGACFAAGWPFLLPRVLGNVEAAFGDPQRAAAYYEQALELGERSGAWAELAQARFDYARALTAQGGDDKRARARALLQEAIDVFTELHMTALLPRAQNLGAALGLRTPSVRPAEIAGEDLQLVQQLLTSEAHEALAERHLLSPQGLRRRTGQLLDQLGVRGPLELMPYVYERGLITQPVAFEGLPLVLMVSDLQGFTPLVERLGDAGAQFLMREHNAILRTQIREHSGLEVTHTGDGIMAAFRSVPEAVACAVAVQRAFARRNESALPQLHLRIGLHAGEPLLEEGRLFGACVIAAVRICSVCEPDRILASALVQRSSIGEAFRFLRRGPRQLKGLREPLELFEVVWRSVGSANQPGEEIDP